MKRNRSVLWMDIVFDCKKNLLQNLLIALQIALLVWASTLLAGFFVPYISGAQPDEDGGFYLYSANSNLTEAYLALDQTMNALSDQAYVENFAVLWEALHSQSEFSFYLCQETVFPVSEFTVDNYFHGASIQAFLGKPTYDKALSTEVLQALTDDEGMPDFDSMQPDGVARYSNPLKTNAYAMRGFLLDAGAMEHFSLAVSSGRLFDESDFATKSTSDETTNVIMGSAYAAYYEVGDKIDLANQISSSAYRATIIGFLEEGSNVTVQVSESAYLTTTECLDYAILFPFTLYEGSYLYKISSAYSYTYSHGWGIVPSIEESNPLAWLALQKKVQDLFVASDIPSAQMGNISYSMIYFKSNTTEELLIILLLFATAVVFCSYTIAAFLKAKLMRARKYYAIQILCGRTPVSIMAQFVAMQGFWHLIAAIGVAGWFHQYVGGNKMPFVSIGISAVLFACVVMQIICLQRRLLAGTDFMQHIMEVQDD
ncbi:MAG: hypothetical protein R3Y06_06770 [Faecalibacterium sp.]